MSSEHIAQIGFFNRFSAEDDDQRPDLGRLYAPIAEGGEIGDNGVSIDDSHAHAGDEEIVWRLLAHAIPAQSYAAAANPLAILGEDEISGPRNIDMQSLREVCVDDNGNEQTCWPQERLEDETSRDSWFHSDFRNVATPYVYRVYERMIEIVRD